MAGSKQSSIRRVASAVMTMVLVVSGFVVLSATSAGAALDRLSITKSGPSQVGVGQRITYTITVSNTVGSRVDEVYLTDQVGFLTGANGTNPTGGTNQLELTTSSSTGRSGTCAQDGNLVRCDKGTMRGFETWTVTISGINEAPNGTVINNTAFVGSTKSAQEPKASNTISTRVDSRLNEPQPDLALGLKGPSTTPPSHDIVYTATINNLGGLKASDVVVTITMPSAVTFLVAEATNLFTCPAPVPSGDGATQTMTCTGGAINDGQNATVQVGVQAPASYSTPVRVTAAVDPYDAIFELDEQNNFAQITTEDPLKSQAIDQLYLEKTDAADPIAPGEQLVYSIRLENKSGSRADYVEVIDGTQGLQASSVTATAQMFNAPKNAVPMTCSVNAPTVSCTTTRFAPGAWVEITIKGTVIAMPGSSILNVAMVNGNINNTGYTSTAATITTVKPSIDLTVTQHRTLPAQPTPVRAADRFDYTITVGNSGLYDANNVIVRQPLPAGWDTSTTKDDVVFDVGTIGTVGSPPVAGHGFSASASGTTCGVDASNVLTCTIPTVRGSKTSGNPGGSTETITLFLIAPHAVGPITSTVTVDPTNIIPENFEDNNTTTTTTPILTGIDLIVSKTDTPDPVARNGTLRYTVTVSNVGTQDASGVVIRDVLPEGAVFRTAADTSPFHNFTCRQDGVNAVLCEGGRINGTYSGSLTQPVDKAVIVIDVFAPDEPDGTGIYHNEVRVDPFDAIAEKDETNNLHLETTTVENTHTGAGMYKELYIEKLDETSGDVAEGGKPYATNGVLDYDLVVGNFGSAAVGATDNLVVRISLPAGSRYRGAYDLAGAGQGAFTCAYLSSTHQVECSGGTVNSLSTRALRIRTFAPNDQGDALIQAVVDPDNRVLEADEGNNSADERTVIKAGEITDVQGTYIDLKVHDIVDSEDPVGTSGTLDYDVTVKNPGSADAFDVLFTATLPNGAVFRDATDAAVGTGAFTCGAVDLVVTCRGGRINAGAARTVKIRVFAPDTPTSSTVQHQMRVIVDPANTIPEGHEGNNEATEITKVTIGGPGGYIDLTVTGTSAIKETDSTTSQAVIPGGQITYTMVVKNSGTDDAINVAFRNWLPAGMQFVSATSDSADGNFFTCGQANGVIDCTGGYVRGTHSNSGSPGQRTITIVAKAPMVPDLQITNQAKVDPGEVIPEQSEINNGAQVINQVKSIVDLKVEMQPGTTSSSGDPGTWTLRGFIDTVEANSRASNVVLVANFSAGTIHINTATPDRTDWSCQVFENPVNQVRCVGPLSSSNHEIKVSVNYFRTSSQAINSFAEIDPEEDTTDSIIGRVVEHNDAGNAEDNNAATASD